MNSDSYVYQTLANHRPTLSVLDAQAIINFLTPHIRQWANGYLSSINLSGSLAKGTAISGNTDVDILVSLQNTTPDTLQSIHNTLFSKLSEIGYSPRRQNVAIGINHIYGNKTVSVDVVPAKKQQLWTSDHSIWSHKKSSWRQTNVLNHINFVSRSGRQDEIKTMKIWRKCHNIDFPSFLLELVTIQALRNNWSDSIATRVGTVFEYIRDELPSARIIDPSNSNNDVADELTQQEKNNLSRSAGNLIGQPWNNAIW